MRCGRCWTRGKSEGWTRAIERVEMICRAMLSKKGRPVV